MTQNGLYAVDENEGDLNVVTEVLDGGDQVGTVTILGTGGSKGQLQAVGRPLEKIWIWL